MRPLYTTVWLTALTLCLCLTGCGPDVVANEEKLQTDLQENGFLTDGMGRACEVYDFSITKRKTQKEEGRDTVYVTLSAKSEDGAVDYTNIEYKMEYELFNDGWMLDTVEPYEAEAWTYQPVTRPTEEELLQYIPGDGQLVSREDISDTEILVTYQYEEQHKYCTVTWQHRVSISFDVGYTGFVGTLDTLAPDWNVMLTEEPTVAKEDWRLGTVVLGYRSKYQTDGTQIEMPVELTLHADADQYTGSIYCDVTHFPKTPVTGEGSWQPARDLASELCLDYVLAGEGLTMCYTVKNTEGELSDNRDYFFFPEEFPYVLDLKTFSWPADEKVGFWTPGYVRSLLGGLFGGGVVQSDDPHYPEVERRYEYAVDYKIFVGYDKIAAVTDRDRIGERGENLLITLEELEVLQSEQEEAG